MTSGPFSALSVGTPPTAHGGTHALKSAVSGGSGLLRITRPMCATTTDDASPSGHTISFWVFWDGPSLPAMDTASGCELAFWYMAGATLSNTQGSDRVIKPTGGWQKVTSTPIGLQSVRQVGVDCYVNSSWTGTIYLDDFAID